MQTVFTPNKPTATKKNPQPSAVSGLWELDFKWRRQLQKILKSKHKDRIRVLQ